MKTILAPVDFSPATESVVAAALALARAYAGRVVLLNITTPVAVMSDLLDSRQNAVTITQQIEQDAARRLAGLEEKLRAELSRVESIHGSGAPAPMIIEQARSLPADYLVMGSHGHTAFYDLFVGSTTGAVMKHAVCPVVIVPGNRSGVRESPVVAVIAALAPGAAPP